MDKTYCHFLWDGITIDNKGNVFSCCHIKPVNMGNIYTSKLSELINTPEIINYRKESLNGKLECYKTCNLLNKEIKTEIDENIEIKYQELKNLHLNFGEKCNISCIMCKHPKSFASNPYILDSKALIENIDISPFIDILLQGGEPLYISECLEYMNFLGKMNKPYIILTNGLLINDKMANKLSLEAKVISISINAATAKTHERVNRGSEFNQILSNIKKLRYYRELNQTDFIINGRMTLTALALKEIPIFLEIFQELGFDKINFGYDKATVPSFLERNPEKKEDIKKQIRKVLESYNPQMIEKIDLLRLKQLGLIL